RVEQRPLLARAGAARLPPARRWLVQPLPPARCPRSDRRSGMEEARQPRPGTTSGGGGTPPPPPCSPRAPRPAPLERRRLQVGRLERRDTRQWAPVPRALEVRVQALELTPVLLQE